MQIDRLPLLLKETSEFKALTSSNDIETSILDTSITNLKNNQYVLSANNDGIARYEKMIGIIPLDSDSLEDRQFRVFTKYNQQVPYTEKSLRSLLDTLIGKDGYTFNMDYQKQTLVLRVAIAQKSMYKTVETLLEECVPLNITLEMSLLYNQYSLLERFTHEQLEQFTHEQMREEVLTIGDRNN